MRADGQLAAGARRLRFTEHLALEGIAPSIGSVGDAYDNSLMETISGLYKAECIRKGPFHTDPLKTINDVEYATMPGSTGGTTTGSTRPRDTPRPPSSILPTTVKPSRTN